MITDAHDAKAAYRLLDCPDVTHDAVLAAHVRHVRDALRRESSSAEGRTCLLIEDTTSLEYHGLKQAAGLGPIGEWYTRGFWLHSTLAVRWDEAADRCRVLGLAGQRAWARPPKRPRRRRKSHGRGKESNHARQTRKDRESARWAAPVLSELGPGPGSGPMIYVADRESDIYEVFQACRLSGYSQVIRAAYPRALAGELDGADLLTAVSVGRVMGVTEVELPREGRTARLEIRSTTVRLKGPPRPGGRLADLTINVVQAREVGAPPGAKPVCWVLLTDLPVATLAQCLRVVRAYRLRWLIEEFHKALKTGLRVEQSQLGDFRRLSALAGILSVVAAFLVDAKWSARAGGAVAEEPVGAADVDASSLAVLTRVYPLPAGRPATRRWLWVSIARLGGFLARKGDGDPGWLTLWRGWQTLMLMVRGYELSTA